MKVGDLISFKPEGFGEDDWSNPCIVLRQWEHLDENKQPMWVCWCDGYEVVMDDTHYDVIKLTSSLLDKTTER